MQYYLITFVEAGSFKLAFLNQNVTKASIYSFKLYVRFSRYCWSRYSKWLLRIYFIVIVKLEWTDLLYISIAIYIAQIMSEEMGLIVIYYLLSYLLKWYAHLYNFLCCVFWFICLRSVASCPMVHMSQDCTCVSVLYMCLCIVHVSLYCTRVSVLYTCLWIVHVSLDCTFLIAHAVAFKIYFI